jgi:hypothetical protein
MKHLKMLGPASIAALAMMAVMGAGTASAVTICSHSGTGTACAGIHGNHYTGAVAANAPKAELTSGFVNVTCKSNAAGTVNGTTGAGSITELSFNTCTDNFGHVCTAVSTGRPWAAQAAGPTTATNGSLTVSNAAGEFACPSPFNTGSIVICKYATPTAVSNVIGGAPASIEAKGIKVTTQPGSNVLCSKEATFSGTYSITTPSSLYIT